MISDAVIENGGMVFSLKAHVFCSRCTEFAIFQVDAESTNLAEFGKVATEHFREKGWEFGVFQEKTFCPSCEPINENSVKRTK